MVSKIPQPISNFWWNWGWLIICWVYHIINLWLQAQTQHDMQWCDQFQEVPLSISIITPGHGRRHEEWNQITLIEWPMFRDKYKMCISTSIHPSVHPSIHTYILTYITLHYITYIHIYICVYSKSCLKCFQLFSTRWGFLTPYHWSLSLSLTPLYRPPKNHNGFSIYIYIHITLHYTTLHYIIYITLQLHIFGLMTAPIFLGNCIIQFFVVRYVSIFTYYVYVYIHTRTLISHRITIFNDQILNSNFRLWHMSTFQSL